MSVNAIEMQLDWTLPKLLSRSNAWHVAFERQHFGNPLAEQEKIEELQGLSAEMWRLAEPMIEEGISEQEADARALALILFQEKEDPGEFSNFWGKYAHLLDFDALRRRIYTPSELLTLAAQGIMPHPHELPEKPLFVPYAGIQIEGKIVPEGEPEARNADKSGENPELPTELAMLNRIARGMAAYYWEACWRYEESEQLGQIAAFSRIVVEDRQAAWAGVPKEENPQ